MFLIDWEYSAWLMSIIDLANMVMTDRLNEELERLVVETYEECVGASLVWERDLLLKVAMDHLWVYWYLIKLGQGQMPAYSKAAWRARLDRVLGNSGRLEDLA